MRVKRIHYIALATILTIGGAALWIVAAKLQTPEGANSSNRAGAQKASAVSAEDPAVSPPAAPAARQTESPAPRAPATGQLETPITETIPSKWKVEFFQKGKDEWAFRTQQRIEQFLASHRHATHFEVNSVDCRTMGCVVRARAFDQSAIPEWQAIAVELSQQQWSEFGFYGTDAMDGSSSIEISMTIERKAR